MKNLRFVCCTALFVLLLYMVYLPIQAVESGTVNGDETDSNSRASKIIHSDLSTDSLTDSTHNSKGRQILVSRATVKVDLLFRFGQNQIAGQTFADLLRSSPKTYHKSVDFGFRELGMKNDKRYWGSHYHRLSEEFLQLNSDYWRRCLSRPAGDYYKSNDFREAEFGPKMR